MVEAHANINISLSISIYRNQYQYIVININTYISYISINTIIGTHSDRYQYRRYQHHYIYIYLFFSSHSLSSHIFFSLLPTRNSDPGSHSRLFSPLPATVYIPWYRKQTLGSLVRMKKSGPKEMVFFSPAVTEKKKERRGGKYFL